MGWGFLGIMWNNDENFSLCAAFVVFTACEHEKLMIIWEILFVNLHNWRWIRFFIFLWTSLQGFKCKINQFNLMKTGNLN